MAKPKSCATCGKRLQQKRKYICELCEREIRLEILKKELEIRAFTKVLEKEGAAPK